MRALTLPVLAVLLAGCALPATDPAAAADATFPALRIETRLGSFTAILYEDQTPETSAFMRSLVESKYYEGRAFGRVIPGFVIQEVDRTGGTTDQKQTVPLEAPTTVMFSAGAFGIARDADPDSGGSEFFVMDHAVSSLYANYTAFAQVVEGMDTVHKIARVPAVRTGPASAAGVPGVPVGLHDRVPVDPVVMTKVTLVDVKLPASEAAKYPLRVGETTRTDTMRATLEWPADLSTRGLSTLTWWVSARDPTPQGQARDPPPVDLADVTIVVEGATIAPEIDQALGRVSFAWQPPRAGTFELRLVKGGNEMATAVVDVTRW